MAKKKKVKRKPAKAKIKKIVDRTIAPPMVVSEAELPIINATNRTEAEIAGVAKISAWKWFVGNYGLIVAFLLIILPLGITKTWGSLAVLWPIGFATAISAICIFKGKKDYDTLVKNGYVEPFK